MTRPPVLAQIRFAQQRAAFRGLALAERFRLIHETNLWGAETSTSGVGSEQAATAAIRHRLPVLLKECGARSLLDAPCGDGPWMARLDLGPVSYVGADIVPALIAQLAAVSMPGRRYVVADLTCDPLPACDVILCRDCLVHLSFENISRAIDNFKRSGARFLLTTTFTEIVTNHDVEDGDWRALNFTRPPFGWPAPEALINEECHEMDGAYRDKSLGLWRLALL
jgi:SAM-dependent methyltransferase